MVGIYIVLAVLLFGALVAIHEFGHFITAKLSGVRVNEFAVGMGPAIIKKQIGETLYSLRILPFGGFCAMEGEDSESEDPRAFGSRPVIFRILIVTAGSIMNLLAGFLVLALVFAPVKEWYIPTVANVSAPSGTEISENSLLAGDRITAVDGYNVYLYNDIFVGLSRSGGDTHSIEVVRDGEKRMLENVKLTQSSEKSGYEIEFATEHTSFFKKIKYVSQNGMNLVRLVKVGLFDLVSGSVSKDDLSGPVGIGKIMVDTAKTSMPSLWYLLAFISINLGIMNLLPLPALDGGRLVFLLIELVFGKAVPAKYEGYVHGAGLVILMLLMLFITYNDIVKLFVK